MEWGSILALVAVAVVLCTAHLGAGLAAGWWMGLKRSVGPPLNLDPFIASVERIRTEMDALSQRSREVPSLDRECAALIARLTLSLDELHRSLSDPARSSMTANTASVEPSHQMGTHAIGNTRLLEWFGRPTIGSRLAEESRRYPFAVLQPLATRVGDEFPEPHEFQLVQCHDLTPTQVRYLVEHRPKDEDVVIGLGVPKPIKFLLARVDDYRSVYMYGRVSFLVTATFVEALHAYSSDAADSRAAEVVS